MKAGTVQIPISEKIVPFINSMPDGNTIGEKATLATVLGLYAAKKVSLGEAADLTGKSIWAFIGILNNCQMSWGEYTKESAVMDEIVMNKLAQGYNYNSEPSSRMSGAMDDLPQQQYLRDLPKFITDHKLFKECDQSEESLRLLRAAWAYAVDEGKKRAKTQTARKMLTMGFPIEQIAEGIDWDLEMVRKLAYEQ